MVEVRPVRNTARSAQSLVVVLFFVLLLYLFFSRDKKGSKGTGYFVGGSADDDLSAKKTSRPKEPRSRTYPKEFGDGVTRSEASTSTSSDSSSRTGDTDQIHKSNKGKRGSSKTNGDVGKPTLSTTQTGGDSQTGASPDVDKSKNQKAKKIKDEKEKKGSRVRLPSKENLVEDWEAPPLVPPLRPVPDHRRERPNGGVYRGRGLDDSLPSAPNTSSGNQISSSDEERKSPSEVTGRYQKWGDFVGLNNTDEPYHPQPGRRQQKSWESQEMTMVNPEVWAAKELGKEKGIDEALLQAMGKAEELGKAKPGQPLWPRALQDEWDDHLGPVPAEALFMARRIAQKISLDHIRLLASVMKERSAKKKNDEHSFDKFVGRIGIKPDHPDLPYKCVLAWYCDTFRCKKYTERMGITDEPIPMTTHDKLGPTALMLGWMQYLAKLNMAQRLFVGVDLFGLAMRVQAMREGEGYRLDLTIFMPGGPETRHKDPSDWSVRMEESASAFRSLHLELVNLFDKSDDRTKHDPFTRRRLILRPGWTVANVNAAKIGEPEPNLSVAQRTLISRPARLLQIPTTIQDNVPDSWKKLNGELQKALSRLSPGEVCYQSIRQFAWDKDTLKPENSTFDATTFWMAWMFIGERVQDIKITEDLGQDRGHDHIRSLDLGGYVPILLSQPPKFMSLNSFPALEKLILSYIPLNERGATAELILNADYGLLQNLEKPRPQTRHFYLPEPFKLYISVKDDKAALSFSDDLDKRLSMESRLYLASGGTPEQAVEMMRGLAERALKRIYVVDESKVAEDGQGVPPKGKPLLYDVARAERLLGHGASSNPPPLRPPSGGPTSPRTTPTTETPDSPSPPSGPQPSAGPPPPATVDLPSPTGNLGGPPARTASPMPDRPTPAGKAAAAASAARDRALRIEQEAAASSPEAGRAQKEGNATSRSHYQPPSVEDVPEDDVPIDNSRFARLNGIESDFNGGGGGR